MALQTPRTNKGRNNGVGSGGRLVTPGRLTYLPIDISKLQYYDRQVGGG